MAFDKSKIQAVFGRIARLLTGVDYLDNPSKQVLQIKNDVTIGGNEFELDWDNFVAGYGMSHRDMIHWLSGHEDWDEDATNVGNACLAYFVATITTSLSKRLVLNIAIVQEVLSELEITYEELVESLEVTHTASRQIEDGCLTQSFYDSLVSATAELAQVQGYESHRNIFAKTAKKAGKPTPKLKLQAKK